MVGEEEGERGGKKEKWALHFATILKIPGKNGPR